MNDLQIKDLLKNDTSTPAVPRDELNQIHQKIENQTFDFISFFNLKSLALASCLVIVITALNININTTPNSTLSESEQQELIEYMFEDAYLENGDSSYAWVDIN